jgi:hypothetical protein
MPTRPRYGFLAPLLVVGGAALFGIGAGGISQVGAKIDAVSAPTSRLSVNYVDHDRGSCADGRPRAQHF